MRADFDVVVIGSGAAGVSCAHRLAASGRRIAILDGGRLPDSRPPDEPYFAYRARAPDQRVVLFGLGREARATGENSPKLRVPSLRYVFEGFADACGLSTNGFSQAGSLAVGGMTNAWGGGVSCFNETDLAGWPIARGDLEPSYRELVRRIGISGRYDDDMGDFFSWGSDLQPPLPLVPAAERLLEGFGGRRERLSRGGFRLGRARNAILSVDQAGRQGCDRSGWCLWGCTRRAVYSARFDLERLARLPHVAHFPGRIAVQLVQDQGLWSVQGGGPSAEDRFALSAPVVAVAAGPIATARLVLDALRLVDAEITFWSCPTAAFALAVPRAIGSSLGEGVFAAAQLSFAASIDGLRGDVFGNIFSAACLPMAEFLARSPLPLRSSIAFFRAALPALLVGNVFMPGHLSDHRLRLRPGRRVEVTWGYQPSLDARLTAAIQRRLASVMRSCGALLMPGGIKPSLPGSDMHYAGTVPMQAKPAPHQATPQGEVRGLPGVFVIDGSALPNLPAKSHTLTIMANADRIASIIDSRLRARP